MRSHYRKIKGKRKVQGVPQSQTTTLPRHQEEKDTDKSKQAQIEQTYEKELRLSLTSPSEVIAMLKGLENTRTIAWKNTIPGILWKLFGLNT